MIRAASRVVIIVMTRNENVTNFWMLTGYRVLRNIRKSDAYSGTHCDVGDAPDSRRTDSDAFCVGSCSDVGFDCNWHTQTVGESARNIEISPRELGCVKYVTEGVGLSVDVHRTEGCQASRTGVIQICVKCENIRDSLFRRRGREFGLHNNRFWITGKSAAERRSARFYAGKQFTHTSTSESIREAQHAGPAA